MQQRRAEMCVFCVLDGRCWRHLAESCQLRVVCRAAAGVGAAAGPRRGWEGVWGRGAVGLGIERLFVSAAAAVAAAVPGYTFWLE